MLEGSPPQPGDLHYILSIRWPVWDALGVGRVTMHASKSGVYRPAGLDRKGVYEAILRMAMEQENITDPGKCITSFFSLDDNALPGTKYEQEGT